MDAKRLKSLGTLPSIGKAVYKDDDGAAADDQIDRISNLPNELLCHILSFLPTKDAIATAVLSTKWQNLFPMIPNLRLVLSDTSSVNPFLESGSIPPTANFSKFMNRLLRVTLRDVESLHCLTLTCKRITSGEEIAGWVGAALALKLQVLDLRVSYLSRPNHLVDQLNGCGLVSLALCLENTSNLPEYKFKLPNLKDLSATLTKFAFVNALIEGSPLLKRLAITDCFGEVEENLRIEAPLLVGLKIFNGFPNFTGALELDAPNLELLIYVGSMDQCYKLTTLKSLYMAHLDVYPNFLPVPFQSDETAIELLTACCDAPKLWLSESLVADLMHSPMLPHFPNLIVVGTQKMHKNLWPLMLNLLKCAPKFGYFVVKEGLDSSYIGRKMYIDSICVRFSQRHDGSFLLTIQRPCSCCGLHLGIS